MNETVDHFAVAEKLLANEVVERNPTLPIALALVGRAAVHAHLAMVQAINNQRGYDDEYLDMFGPSAYSRKTGAYLPVRDAHPNPEIL